MSGLREDELPRGEPFWMIDDVSDARVVGRVLRDRFPEAFRAFESALEEADPFEIVYPGNPNEYSDVVNEMLVLLAPENANLNRIDRSRLAGVLHEGLARRFGEIPDKARVSRTIDLILERASDGKNG